MPPPPPFEWDAAMRERIIQDEVKRRLVEEEVRREFEVHGGFGPGPFFAPDFVMPPPLMPMPMLPPPHALPPMPFEGFGAWPGFDQFGPRGPVGFGQMMLPRGDERRWSPPRPKPKRTLELREIGPSERPEAVSSKMKVPKMKRKADEIAATTLPRKVQKPAKDWSCALCQMTATCEAGLNEHLEGRKHKAKLAKCGASNVINYVKNNLQTTTGNKDSTGPSDEPKKICILVDGAMHEVVQKNNYLWCDRCKVRCDSNVTMAGHLRGKKHSQLNKVWTSILAVRMNKKTEEGLASPCGSKLNANDCTEIPAVIMGGLDMAIKVDESGPIEIKKESTNMGTEVHENSPVETKKEDMDMTNDGIQLVPKEE